MPGSCPFCKHTDATRSFLPDTFFNGKTFQYLLCKSCALIYVSPFPAPEDYAAMYPPSYQNGINQAIIDDRKKLPGLRFPYAKHFELIKSHGPGNKLADYGCGQANFILNALAKGYLCTGVEYNPKHIAVLKKEIPAGTFYQIDNFLESGEERYDVIRLSNVLEHLDNPNRIIEILLTKLSPSGILLVEGPIETNFSLALLLRKTYFRLSGLLRKKRSSHPPTHIFFANSKNQREFFRNHSLEELHFEIKEYEWPFPESLAECKGPGGFLKYAAAKFSLLASRLNKGWGNTFIYVGRKK